MKSFDAAAFKQQFRAAAAARGIDPAVGATGYQLANRFADEHKQAAKDTGWWRKRAFWDNAGLAHSTTEEEALRSIRAQCDPSAGQLDVLEQWGVALLREVFSELRRERQDGVPLRELHRRRGVKVEWVDVGAGAPVAVEVEISVVA